MKIWRLGLLVAALAGSTAGFLWLVFVAADAPRGSLLTLVVVFLLATAVTAWHHRERLTARLLSAHLAIGSIALFATAYLVYWAERWLGPAFLPGQDYQWHYLIAGLLAIGVTFVTWNRAQVRAEVGKVALPKTAAEAEPPPPAGAPLDGAPNWAGLAATLGARDDLQRLRQLRTLQRLYAVAKGEVGAADDPPERRLEHTLRTLRQEVQRLDAESAAQQEAGDDDALTLAAEFLEWGVQKLPEVGQLDVSDLIMAKTVADIRALHDEVEHRFVDHRELLAIHPIDRGNSNAKCDQRAAALKAALPILQANGMRLSEDLIAATPELKAFESVTGFQVVALGERGYVTFEGNGRREAIQRAVGDEPVLVEVREFKFKDPRTQQTIARRVDRVRRWKGVVGLLLGVCALSVTQGCASPPPTPRPAPQTPAGAVAEVRDPLFVGDAQVELLRTTSDYSRIRVRQQGSVRTLWFVEDDGLEIKETAIDLARPAELQIPYTRAMFASHLLLPSPPARCLLVGLGGGAMVRFLQHHAPDVELDAVEIDPAVVAIADEWFGTRPGPRTRIHTADGFVFVAEALAAGTPWDVVYMDAFLKPAADTDSRGLQLRLKTERFFADLGELLRPGGLVVFNMLRGPELLDDIRTIARVFPSVRVIQGWGGNVVVTASFTPTPPPAELKRRAVDLEARGLGIAFQDLARALEPAD